MAQVIGVIAIVSVPFIGMVAGVYVRLHEATKQLHKISS